MRERTPMTHAVPARLPKLRLIAETVNQNASIDLGAAAERGNEVVSSIPRSRRGGEDRQGVQRGGKPPSSPIERGRDFLTHQHELIAPIEPGPWLQVHYLHMCTVRQLRLREDQ
jgi:hypothetical protein